MDGAGFGPRGKARPVWRGVLLTVVTLGLYPLWWHYRTHDELMSYLRRPNRLRVLWFAHAAIWVGAVLFVLLVFLPAAVAYLESQARPASQAPLDVYRLMRATDLLAPAVVLYLGVQLTFLAYVVGQHRALYPRLSGVPSWLSAALLFLLLDAAAQAMNLARTGAAAVLGLVALVAAYAMLQGAYNRFWREEGYVAVTTPSRVLDRLPDGRALLRADAPCAGCGARIAYVGAAGSRTEALCPYCGQRGGVELPGEPAGSPPAAAL